MTPKENFLVALNHGKPEWVPCYLSDAATVGFGAGVGPWIEKGDPAKGGYDGFGVHWVYPKSGGGAPIPAPNEFLLEDVTEWKSIVKFPDVDAFDWAKQAEEELKGHDRTQKVIDFGSGNGPFERLAALMGFEGALCAMYLEPEASYELLEAITDYKIKIAEKVAKYYKADAFTNYDDIATESRLFMSPDTYRTIIKPHHKRLNSAVKALGMIPIQHTCGKADELVEDFIETGAAAWTPVQPSNDIAGILKKYGDRFTIIGGYDTVGLPGSVTASEEVIRAEVRRSIDAYGKYPSYIFFGFRLVNSLDAYDTIKQLIPIIEEANMYAHMVAGK